jgi:hypothetical protein
MAARQLKPLRATPAEVKALNSCLPRLIALVPAVQFGGTMMSHARLMSLLQSFPYSRDSLASLLNRAPSGRDLLSGFFHRLTRAAE